LLALLGVCLLAVRVRQKRRPRSLGYTAPSRSPARRRVRADRGWVTDRGRAQAVGRLTHVMLTSQAGNGAGGIVVG